jgi:hypothetical protein
MSLFNKLKPFSPCSVALVTISIILSACSSAPPEVSASRSLITAQPISAFSHKIPEDLTDILNTYKNGEKFDYKHLNVTVKNNYTSALGQYCRDVELIGKIENQTIIKNQQQRIVCRAKGNHWFLIPQVIESPFKPLAFVE